MTRQNPKKERPTAPRRWLKPAQIAAEYSIPPSSLHFYCEKLEPATDRLPSFMLPGRNRKKSTRLVCVEELVKWLAKHRVNAA